MVEESSSKNTNSNRTGNVQNYTFSAAGNLVKHLPTGTFFLFQFVNPVVTNSGQCNTINKWLCSILLLLCGSSCAISSFTDSCRGNDNQRHYGFVTRKGLWPSPPSNSVDLSRYKLGVADFVHAAISLLVFAVLGLLDTNTVHCFYPGFESTEKSLLHVLPTVIGAFASWVFIMFPNTRHGIGYHLTSDSNETSPESKDTTEDQNDKIDNA